MIGFFDTQVKRTQLIILEHCADLGVRRHKVIRVHQEQHLQFQKFNVQSKEKNNNIQTFK